MVHFDGPLDRLVAEALLKQHHLDYITNYLEDNLFRKLTMKIVLCTTPIRPVPTTYPPFGGMAIIQSLRSAGYDPYFYDIDGLRPSFDEVVQFFKDQAPDVLGISAVVSTACAYVKELIRAIKEVSPHTKIVVGGNLAASSEILLRLYEVDVCCIGEGEGVMVNLVKYWEGNKTSDDYSELKQIKGLSYLDEDGEMIFTGYDVAIPATEFLAPDWTILEQYSRIENYITTDVPASGYKFRQDPRFRMPHRKDKKTATIITAKGCVARCTFCHRWDKGYRHWPVDQVIDNIKYVIDRYDVGLINFGDENFGSDRKKVDELIEKLKPLDILWRVQGVRCRTVDLDLLRRMKEAGCVSLEYGMETGSPRILEIMEKATDLQDNINAAKWTYEAGLHTTYKLLLAMPGEDHKTIAETTDFIKKITEFLPEPPRRRMSFTYIQALPGTPVYEYARDRGLIGKTLEDEEKYLLKISDVNTADDTKFLNFTNSDYFTVQTWKPKIVFDAQANWYKKHNWITEEAALKALYLDYYEYDDDTEAAAEAEHYTKHGEFTLPHVVANTPIFYRILSLPFCYPLRAMFPLVYVLSRKTSRELPKREYLSRLWQLVFNRLKPRLGLKDFRSLRKVMKDRTPTPATKSEESMLPLRDGR